VQVLEDGELDADGLAALLLEEFGWVGLVEGDVLDLFGEDALEAVPRPLDGVLDQVGELVQDADGDLLFWGVSG